MNEVRLAHTAYGEYVRQAAADEATLKLMVAAMSDTEQLPDASIIRSMFDANRIRVGVQAASELVCFVMFPAELEGIASAARVHALGNCWWLRPDARAMIPGGRLSYIPAVKMPVVHLSMPLDPEAAKQQDPNEDAILSPLPAFSSGDSTAVICERAGESVLYSIAPLKIGLNHASTLCFGNVKHDCFLPLEADPQHIFGVDALIPVEQLVAEVYVHRDLVRQGFTFRAILNDRQFRPEMYAFGGARVDVAALGGAFQVIEPTQTLDNPVKAPPYHDLMNFVFDRLQHVRQDFFCFRLRLPTPPLGMRVNLIAGQDLAPCATERIY